MTWALCFACGETKFGAICPCPQCGVASSGDMTLDILFSDHYLSPETLAQFGKVVKVIQEEAEDPALGLSAFLYHVTRTYPGLLTYEPSPQARQQFAALLAPLDLPPVVVQPGHRSPHEDQEEEGPEAPGRSQHKPWWQFWKRGP